MRSSLAMGTHKSYSRVLTQFLAYAQAHGLNLSSGDALMAAVAGFLGSKIRDGYAAAVGRQLYAALCLRWSAWVGHLQPLHRAIRGWEKQRPVVKRPPLIRPLAVAMALRLVVWGWPSLGAAVLLAFHCYLRIGELLRVEDWHLVPPRSIRAGRANRFGFVHIPKAKTGTQQDVEVTDPDVAWVVALARRTAAAHGGRVFPHSEHSFRKRFGQCAASLGLPATIVPHSMRHGGATHDYVTGRLTTDQIRVRGRWKGEKAMHHYVGAMRSALANLHVPRQSVQWGDIASEHLRASFVWALEKAPRCGEVEAYRAALLVAPESEDW